MVTVDENTGPATGDVLQETITVQEPPIEERLRYGTEFHDRILTEILHRKRASEEEMSALYPVWDRVDEYSRLRVDMTRPATTPEGGYHPSKRAMPFDRGLVIPIQYVMIQTVQSQMESIYGSRNPLIQVVGAGPEDMASAKLMEIALAYDCRRMGATLVIHQAISDVLRYGIAPIYDTWEAEHGWIWSPPLARELLGGSRAPSFIKALAPGFFEDRWDWGKKREGNVWRSIDPRRFYPDPRFSVSNMQKGEFWAFTCDIGISTLISSSQKLGGPYFNIEAAKEHATSRSGGGGRYRENVSGRRDPRRASRQSFGEHDPSSIELLHIQWRLVPRDYKLGSGDKPEIWWFTVANESVIIRAHRSGYAHDEFTCSVGEYSPDTHALSSPGLAELTHGIQELANWLISSRIANIQRVINNAMILDPKLIEVDDLLNTNPGGHVRLSKLGSELNSVSGNAIHAAVKQLNVSDVTHAHFQLLSFLIDWAQRLTGANDPVQGMPLNEQRTLGEVQQIVASATQRAAEITRIFDEGCIEPLARRAISNRKQLTEMEQWYRVGGDLVKELLQSPLQDVRQAGEALFVKIGANSLAGHYDYVPVTGVTPSDPSRQSQGLLMLLQTAAQYPMLVQPGPDGKALDIREIAKDVFRSLGVRNVEQYFSTVTPMPAPGMPPAQQVRVVSNEEYARGVQAGDYVDPAEVQGERAF